MKEQLTHRNTEINRLKEELNWERQSLEIKMLMKDMIGDIELQEARAEQQN